jgi:Glycosyl hydrolase family 26
MIKGAIAAAMVPSLCLYLAKETSATPCLGAYAGHGDTDYLTLEAKLGVKLATVHKFVGWGEDPFTFVSAVGDRMPLVTIEPTTVSWSAIASGTQDSYLKMLGRKTASYGRPVYFRIGPEMNGRWVTWKVTSSLITTFKTAWARIAQILQPAGGRLVWCPSDATSRGLPSPTSYYPGRPQVDIIGIDSYTWDDGETSFDDLLSNPYPLYSGLDPTKPVWVCETGCNQTSIQPTWVANMVKSTVYPNVKAIVYFDAVGSKDWRLTSQATIDVLKNALSSA